MYLKDNIQWINKYSLDNSVMIYHLDSTSHYINHSVLKKSVFIFIHWRVNSPLDTSIGFGNAYSADRDI